MDQALSNIANGDIFYQAYLNRDSRFEGIFFLGVKTTGVFCRPGCGARPPLRENVEFFSSAAEAQQNGYRACKKCRPLQLKGESPKWVSRAMQLLESRPDAKLSDDALRDAGIDPVRLRRYFKAQFGQTFQAYQREWRINQASRRIGNGAAIVDSALDSGYESLSAFNESFRKLTGATPGKIGERTPLSVGQIRTPLGPMIAAVSDQGLYLLEFTDRKALPRQVQRVQKYLGCAMLPGRHDLLGVVQQQINEYFAGSRQSFDIPLGFCGSEFQQMAWRALCKIPYGETRNYQQQAIACGKPDAIRAIASANAANAIAIIVPCHRVIAKSGGLAGYAGGLRRKQYLIDLEHKHRK